MSRAFVREDADADSPLPDLPVSPHPNRVTARGLAQLRDRLATAETELARLKAREDRFDRMPERVAERDIRYLRARLASAILTHAPAPLRAGFGHRVTLRDGAGRERLIQIVGEDEADARAGLVTLHAPIAQALLGLEPGDEVEAPGRAGVLTVVAIAIPTG